VNKSRRRFEKLGAGIILVPAAVAVFLSLFAVTAGAHADDITVISSVVDSTPSATPTQFVTLPIGSDAATAPIVNIQLTGLEPYSFVQVFAQSDPVLISSGFADKYGVYKAKANLPPTLEPGTHTITALVQDKGETTAALKPLIHFAVSGSGTVVKSSGGTGGGSTGGSTGGGGSSGGTTGGGTGGTGGGVTESPVATPQPSSNLSIGGVLLVGGAESSSSATYDPNGAPARVAVSVANNYSKSLSLVVSFSITNLFGQEVARIANYKVESLKPKANLLVSAQTKNGIGQWGFYNTKVTVSPPSKIDGLNLYSVTRDSSFFVWPMIPTSIVLLLLAFELLRRIFWPYLRKRGTSGDEKSLNDNEEGN
jgi:hypothetical protein